MVAVDAEEVGNQEGWVEKRVFFGFHDVVDIGVMRADEGEQEFEL